LAHLPLTVQQEGVRAVELTSTRVKDGVYFFPRGTAIEEIAVFAGLSPLQLPSERATGPDGDHDALTFGVRDGSPFVAELGAAKRIALGLPIDLNAATAEELILLPGIGEKTAGQIVGLRQTRGRFQSLSELTAVPGIKERRIELLRKHLFIRPHRPAPVP
jgi:competence protein ComEA